MSIPNTSNAAAQFIEDEPDWGQPVQVDTAWKTAVTATRDGGEQRAARQLKPKLAIEYSITALDATEYSKRKAKGLSEQSAPCVVPIWTDPETLVSSTSTSANLGVTLDKRKFRAGSYAYFTQAGLTATFRKVTGISGTTLTLEAQGGVPAFTAGAKVYPCILGFRQTVSFAAQKLDETTEGIAVEEI